MIQYVSERKHEDPQNHVSEQKSNSDVFKAKTELEVYLGREGCDGET